MTLPHQLHQKDEKKTEKMKILAGDDEADAWDHDDYQPFENPESNETFKRAITGNASEFGKLVVLMNRDRVVSSGEENTKWLKCKGFRWAPAELGDIKRLMHPLTEGAELHSKLREAYEHYSGNKKMMAQILKVKNKAKEEAFMTRVVKQTCARLFSRGYRDVVNNLDKDKKLLGFNNGVYDLERGLFRDGRPEDKISKSVGYDYTPNDQKHRPEVEAFFAKLFPDEELRDNMLRYLASCLSGYTRDHMIFVGHDQNGVYKLLNLMKQTLGSDYASAIDQDVIIREPHSGMLDTLKGKRFAYISETVDVSRINESTLRIMIGEDFLFSQDLYTTTQQTEPGFKLFMVCNHLPVFNSAMLRRIRVIPFQSQELNRYANVATKDEESWRLSFMCMLLEQHKQLAKPRR
ncbi:hypothetical protein HK102_007305 [Quaeritorhiza haematococci]|nr:hypothetical protein HK102_007305 [Quaeritorhiza haematococci]